jgi:hypothetical protein
MTRTPPSYGRRGRVSADNSGIRPTAPTFGKAKFGTFSNKATGHLTVESEAERFVTHLLSIDPRVTAFSPQPFCVDLLQGRMLFTRDDIHAAKRGASIERGARFYTPDFALDWENGLHHALEVKAEGFEGDKVYFAKLEQAALVLEANGYPLSVLVFPADTAHPIRMNARVLKQALHHLGTHLTDELIGYVTLRCESGPVSVRALCADLAIPPGLIPVLLVAGVLQGDLATQVLDGNFELSLAHGDLTHLSLLERLER